MGGFDEKLWIFSDWEMSARLIAGGYQCARTNLVTFEHKMKSMPGGAAGIYERQDKVQEACQLIAGKYGDAVKIKWVPAHNQYEVRFNWKKFSAPRS